MRPNSERQHGVEASAAATAWKVAKQVIADAEGIDNCTVAAVAQLAAGVLAMPIEQDVGALVDIDGSLEKINETIQSGMQRGESSLADAVGGVKDAIDFVETAMRSMIDVMEERAGSGVAKKRKRAP